MLGLDQLAVVKDLPSPDGEWEVIQHIGESELAMWPTKGFSVRILKL